MRPRGEEAEEEEGGMKTACSRGIQGGEGAGQVRRAPGKSGRGLGGSNSRRLGAYISISFP